MTQLFAVCSNTVQLMVHLYYNTPFHYTIFLEDFFLCSAWLENYCGDHLVPCNKAAVIFKTSTSFIIATGAYAQK